jgi:hypothetical protein
MALDSKGLTDTVPCDPVQRNRNYPSNASPHKAVIITSLINNIVFVGPELKGSALLLSANDNLFIVLTEFCKKKYYFIVSSYIALQIKYYRN